MYSGVVPRAATHSDVFNAIAEPRRREILVLLARSEQAVGDLVIALDLAQPSVSKHLRVLETTGLVQVRRNGRQKFYRTNAAALRPVHDWTRFFESLWSNQLNRIKQKAEEKTR
jgi:DNA-binding transcriptional ArsR family regulator